MTMIRTATDLEREPRQEFESVKKELIIKPNEEPDGSISCLCICARGSLPYSPVPCHGNFI